MGVKLAGIILEGSSEADFRLSIRLVMAILIFEFWCPLDVGVRLFLKVEVSDVQVLLMLGFGLWRVQSSMELIGG